MSYLGLSSQRVPLLLRSPSPVSRTCVRISASSSLAFFGTREGSSGGLDGDWILKKSSFIFARSMISFVSSLLVTSYRSEKTSHSINQSQAAQRIAQGTHSFWSVTRGIETALKTICGGTSQARATSWNHNNLSEKRRTPCSASNLLREDITLRHRSEKA